MHRITGRTFLVVEATDPAKVGFVVSDIAAWTRRLRETSLAPSRPATADNV